VDRKNAERDTGRDRCTADGDGQLLAGPLGRFEYEVDQANTLVREAIRRLSRHCPEHTIGETASEDLQRMRPCFEGALEALAEIERCRGLTQKEFSQRRAFKMLLEGQADQGYTQALPKAAFKKAICLPPRVHATRAFFARPRSSDFFQEQVCAFNKVRSREA
jgi:hypothetical protein